MMMTIIRHKLLLSYNNFIMFLLTRPMFFVFSSSPSSSSYITQLKYIENNILLFEFLVDGLPALFGVLYDVDQLPQSLILLLFLLSLVIYKLLGSHSRVIWLVRCRLSIAQQVFSRFLLEVGIVLPLQIGAIICYLLVLLLPLFNLFVGETEIIWIGSEVVEYFLHSIHHFILARHTYTNCTNDPLISASTE